MKSVIASLAFAGAATILLGGCGGGGALGANERRYADACIASSGEAYRALCECSSRIVGPKLTAGELTSMEKMTGSGQSWNEEKAKAAGFSLQDTGTFGQKKQDSFAEMSRACGGQI